MNVKSFRQKNKQIQHQNNTKQHLSQRKIHINLQIMLFHVVFINYCFI